MDRHKTSILFPIILLVIIVSAIIYFQVENKNSLDDYPGTKTIKSTLTATKTKNEFGVWTNAYVANPGEKFDQNVFNDQVKLWNTLGINHIRTNFERNNWQPVDWTNDLMIKAAKDNGLKITFIVESPFTDFYKEANYETGYRWGKIVGAKYAGKINYYQLANEVSGSAILPNRNGLKEADYDAEKYQILKEYLLGLSQGLHETDPKAKQIVSAHWLGIAVIDMLIRDGLDIDVIGWNWYSDMGENVSEKKLDEGEVLNIPDHFSKYNKEFWITELNYNAGDSSGEEPQANFLQKFLDNCQKSGKVNGYFIYKLVDSICTEGDKPTSHLGIMKDKTSTQTKSGCTIGDTKKAFSVYQRFIRTNR